MPRTPQTGKLPTFRYEFSTEQDTHKVCCTGTGCTAHCASSDPLVVRRFVQTHIGEHARARIFRPEPEPVL